MEGELQVKILVLLNIAMLRQGYRRVHIAAVLQGVMKDR